MANLEQSRSWIPKRIVCKTYVFISSNLLSWHGSHTIALNEGTIFAKKADFFAKKCWHQQN